MTLAILSEDKVRIGIACADKWEAIAAAGELLVAGGHVGADYPGLMQARERIATTYVGNAVAVPHGTREAMTHVRAPGISVVQIPAGVDFGDGQIARLVLGLAACDDRHLELLTHIALVCADEMKLDALLRATSPAEMVAALRVEGTVGARGDEA
jgi:mannitol PTS system EIIA component